MKNIMKHKNKGFTIVELIVVMAIIAILILIAVPTFTKYIDYANRTSEAATQKTIYAATIVTLSDDYRAAPGEKGKVTPGTYAFNVATNGNIEAEIEEGVSGMTPKTADGQGIIVYGYDEDGYKPNPETFKFATNMQTKWRVLLKSSVNVLPPPNSPPRDAYPIDAKGDIYIISPNSVWYKNGVPLE